MTLRQGFDYHGVVTHRPEYFVSWAKHIVSDRGEVHILTGIDSKRAVDDLLSYNNGVKWWTHYFSIQEELVKQGLPHKIDEKGNYHFAKEPWDRAKADYARRVGLDCHIDDSWDYLQTFTTPFLQYNKGLNGHRYRIYCDMDGVLCDYIKRIMEHYPDAVKKDWIQGQDVSFGQLAKTIPDFWETLDWMPGGRKLWNFIKHFEPSILSAPSRYDERSVGGKVNWIENHLGPNVDPFLIKSPEKQFYSRPGRILIDDMEYIIEQWRARGGIGIVHVDADQTIRELVKILKIPV